MMERIVFDHLIAEQVITEYVANCAWQIPLLAAGALLLVKIVRPSVVVQHLLWLSVLVLAMVLPMRGIEFERDAPARSSVKSGVESKDETMAMVAPGRATVYIPPIAKDKGAMDGAPGKPIRNRSLKLSVRMTHWLVVIYAGTLLLGALRFGRAWRAARRLVAESRVARLPEASMRALEEYGERLGVDLPRLRESSEIAGPVIVGAMRPVLLLPERFTDHAEEEIKAAVCHELAHVSRRDYLVNMVCQVVALPVVWHPATMAIQQRICRTREMVCDAMAAEEMCSSGGYARCLVSLAQQMLREEGMGRQTQAIGLFNRNTIEERVMGLTETKAAMSVWVKVVRAVSGVAAMAAVTMTAAVFHVRPAFAEPVVLVQSAPVAVGQAKPSPDVVDKGEITDEADSVNSKRARVAVETEKRDGKTIVIARGKRAKVTPEKGDYVHQWTTADGEPFTLVNQDPKEPTEEEKSSVEARLNEPMELHIDEPFNFNIDVDSKFLVDPKMKIKIDALQKNWNSDEMKKQMEKANKAMNDPAFKKQMEELQKKMPKMAAQANLAAADALKGNLELQMKLEDLKNIQPDIDLRKFQIEKDGFDGKKFKILMDSRMQDANEQMAKAQKEFESGEMKRRLEAAEQMLQDVKRQMEKMQAK